MRNWTAAALGAAAAGNGVIDMKAFLLACLCAIVLAVAAAGVLNSLQKPAAQAFATVGVRL